MFKEFKYWTSLWWTSFKAIVRLSYTNRRLHNNRIFYVFLWKCLSSLGIFSFTTIFPLRRSGAAPQTWGPYAPSLRFGSPSFGKPLRHVGKEPRSQNSHHISLESTKHVCLTIKRVFRCLRSKSFDDISKEDTMIFVKTHWFGVTKYFHLYKST